MNAFDPRFLEEVKARTSVVDVVHERYPLKRRGKEWTACCPFHAEKSASFTVNEDKGFYHCFGCGAHGDAIGFVMRADKVSFGEAVRMLAVRAGLAAGAAAPARPLQPVARPGEADQQDEKQRLIDWARRLWADRRPWEGTLVEVYLRNRGIVLAGAMPTLGFHPALRHRDSGQRFPAMLAPMQQVDGRVTGIHRTFLAPDGRGKAAVASAKKMGGVCWGAAIRFGRAGRRLAIGEGIETCLSVRQALAKTVPVTVWAAGSLGNIAGRGDPHGPTAVHPGRPDKRLPTVLPAMDGAGIVLPEEVEEVLLLGDADGDRPTGEALMERAARRFHAQGRRVRIAWAAPGGDFNDMIRGAA